MNIHVLEEWSLLFGLLYPKFARNDELALEALRVMADFGDIHQYVDAGHWRKHQKDRDIDLFDRTLEQRTSMIFDRCGECLVDCTVNR